MTVLQSSVISLESVGLTVSISLWNEKKIVLWRKVGRGDTIYQPIRYSHFLADHLMKGLEGEPSHMDTQTAWNASD